MRWYYLDSGAENASINMAVDEFFLERVHQDRTPILRLYEWLKPSVSIGYAQTVRRHIDLEYCNAQSIPVVRRITGGKAIFHHLEITYSLAGPTHIFPFSTDLLSTYQVIAQAFIQTFRRLKINAAMAPRSHASIGAGVSSCFAQPSAYEILAEQGGAYRKILGSAQKRTRHGVLQHGSLLIEYHPEDWKKVFLNPGDISSDHATSLHEILGKEVSIDQIKRVIVDSFADVFQISFDSLKLDSGDLEKISEKAIHNYPDLALKT